MRGSVRPHAFFYPPFCAVLLFFALSIIKTALTQMEITKLIETSKQGDEKALSALYGLYVGRVTDVCHRIVGNRMVAEEIANDALLVAFNSLNSLRTPQHFGKWVCVIAKNMALRELNHHKKENAISLEEINEIINTDEDDLTENHISKEDIERAIAALPNGYEKVFRLSVIDGLSHKDISKILGIAPHSSSSQLARGRKLLRDSLSKLLIALISATITLVWYLMSNDKESTYKPDIASSRNTEKSSMPKQEKGTHIAPTAPIKRHSITPPANAHPTTDSVQHNTAAPISNDSIGTIEQHDSTKWNIPMWEYSLPETEHLAQTYTPHNATHNRSWAKNIRFSFVGSPIPGANQTNDFVSLTDYAKGGRMAKIHNWNEYEKYLKDNAQWMDTADVANIRNMIQHSPSPTVPITETKHHFQPRTYQVVLSYPVGGRWNLMGGVSYTRMKSVFESGDGNSSIIKTQKLYYIGVPIGISYRLAGNDRWQLYTSASLGIDIPVKGSLSTKYLYTGPFDHSEPDSLMMPTTHSSIKAPWQINVGIGIGVQYRIAPKITLYFEPSLHYYIPTGTPVETYRTEHPVTIALPAGLRFTW